jgi:hypothetical protein
VWKKGERLNPHVGFFSKKGKFFWRYSTKRICAIFTFAELVKFKFALFEIES